MTTPPLSRDRTRRAVLGSTAGAVVEGYDLLLYGVFGALVFPVVFFPVQSSEAAVLLSFATYFVGFVARPLGGALFGHLGDRIGRKRTMLITLWLVTIGTVGCGLLPGFAQIGPAAAVLLVVLRVVQGFGFGGEWGGAVLLSMESGSPKRAGFLGSFPQAGASVGLFLANLTAFGLSAALPREAFLAWGWRVPFLVSGVLIVVGFWLRSRVAETPAFERLRAVDAIERHPIRQLFRRQPQTLALTILLKAGSGIPVFLFTAFVLAYAARLGYSTAFVTLAVTATAFLSSIATPLFGMLADRVGPARLWQAGAAAMALFGFVYFALLESGSAPLAAVAIVVSMPLFAVMFAAEPALTAPRFEPAWRYSGSSFAFNIGSVLGGGLAPFVAQLLVTRFGSATAVAWYMAGGCVIGIAAVAGLRRMDRRAAVTTAVVVA